MLSRKNIEIIGARSLLPGYKNHTPNKRPNEKIVVENFKNFDLKSLKKLKQIKRDKIKYKTQKINIVQKS